MNTPFSVSAKAAGIALNHFWNCCVGAGRANEGLRANWLEHLELASRECGFRYVRFHGLFHDDMFVCREQGGKQIYNFQYIDALFDGMLDLGVRPFIELGFCPRHLATKQETVMWWKGHGSPPKDYKLWGELVDRFVRHCVQRYGLEEVRQWYFEVWNEPNLGAFFAGTKRQYFDVYRTSATVIKAIDSGLRVGGPATSNFVADGRFDGETEDATQHITHRVKDLESLEWKAVWVEDFLRFCEMESLPVDFISCHPYPTDFALDEHGACQGRSRSINSTRTDLRWLRKVVCRSPFPQAEIHLTEWSTSPSSRDHSHDAIPAAAFVVKTNIESRGLVDSLSYWVFTDVFEEAGAGDTIFHGGFGMINFQGIVKPTFHAYRFLASLGDQELAAEEGVLISRHGRDGAISAVVYHYPEQYPQAVGMAQNAEDAEAIMNYGEPKQVAFQISHLQPGASFRLETLDRNHGFALETWHKMNKPEPPSREQTQLLREAAMALKQEFFIVNPEGVLDVATVLQPWSIACLTEISKAW